MAKNKRAIIAFIEVKSAKGHLRPSQQKFLEEFRSSGAIAFMARSWDDVRIAFAARGIQFKVG